MLCAFNRAELKKQGCLEVTLHWECVLATDPHEACHLVFHTDVPSNAICYESFDSLVGTKFDDCRNGN